MRGRPGSWSLRPLLLLAALCFAGCVGTEKLEAEYCAQTHRSVECETDAECCATHRCLPVPSLRGTFCIEVGKCIRETVGPNEGFVAATPCGCNADCLSKRCTDLVCE